MATNLVAFRPTVTRLCAVSGSQDIRPGASPSSNWWSPLFGWSTDPDYIDSCGKTDKIQEPSDKLAANRKQPRRSRYSGCFTDEKARQLRMLTNETSSFHDGMYHSVVASRLASDFNRRHDQ